LAESRQVVQNGKNNFPQAEGYPHESNNLRMQSILLYYKFQYFNKIKNTVMPLPEIPNLAFRVLVNVSSQEVLISNEKILVNYENGVYTIKVKIHPSQWVTRKDVVSVQFSTNNFPSREKSATDISSQCSWIYTESESSEPTIVQKTRSQIESLLLSDQAHYYDIPELWDSRNWFCQYIGEVGIVGDFITKTTTSQNPLIFNLDSIVLVRKDTAGESNTQDIEMPRQQSSCVQTAISAMSFLPFMKVLTSLGDFEVHNFIIPSEQIDNFIIFNGKLFKIGFLRTVCENDWVRKKFIVGARAAKMIDKTVAMPLMESINSYLVWAWKFNQEKSGLRLGLPDQSITLSHNNLSLKMEPFKKMTVSANLPLENNGISSNLQLKLNPNLFSFEFTTNPSEMSSFKGNFNFTVGEGKRKIDDNIVFRGINPTIETRKFGFSFEFIIHSSSMEAFQIDLQKGKELFLCGFDKEYPSRDEQVYAAVSNAGNNSANGISQFTGNIDHRENLIQLFDLGSNAVNVVKNSRIPTDYSTIFSISFGGNLNTFDQHNLHNELFVKIRFVKNY
jgi:hypothetical protein